MMTTTKIKVAPGDAYTPIQCHYINRVLPRWIDVAEGMGCFDVAHVLGVHHHRMVSGMAVDLSEVRADVDRAKAALIIDAFWDDDGEND